MTRFPLILGGLFTCAFAGIAAASPDPFLLWNASPSAPLGLYFVDRSANAARGDMVALRPDPSLAHFLARRHYLPLGLPLLKRIAALPGERVCRFSVFVTINGVPVAIARLRDRAGRPLPAWYGCRQVAWDEVFLLNPAPDSLDGRYFGVTRRARIIGKAHPILIRSAPRQPLRWAWMRTDMSSPQQEKEVLP